MSEDPTPDVPANGSPVEPTESPSGGGDTAAELRREVERLRTQLAKATAEAEMYRQAAYSMLEQLVPYTPPTEEELHDMLHGPRGRPILEIIDEYEAKYVGS
jgi:hypothetical protein